MDLDPRARLDGCASGRELRGSADPPSSSARWAITGAGLLLQTGPEEEALEARLVGAVLAAMVLGIVVLLVWNW